MQTLQRASTIGLIQGFEASSNVLPGDGGPIAGIPRWALLDSMGRAFIEHCASWLNLVGYARVYPSFYEDEATLVELIPDSDPLSKQYCCLQTLGWKRVSIEDTAVYQVDTQRFLQSLADLLEIPDRQRTFHESCIPNVLWKLGPVQLNTGFYIPLYIVRELNVHLVEIMNYLEDRCSPGIVLSTGKMIPDKIGWPPGIVVRHLVEALVDYEETTRLDKAWLTSLVTGQVIQSTTKHLPVHYDPVRQVLSIMGKPDWPIKGRRQSLAIAYMFNQATKGRWELQAKEILEATRQPGQVGGVKHLQSLFSLSEDWERYITRSRRGIYRFKLD